ncbi:sporulation integral membrane protein YtvI [Mechercharimyces sp. CAU 1602]|uniref:sporulation integral membrane protein YtvI n=1 Tax=Mechercharimyces sp. CAU 1602 TaxID=2973933 RepID=UPI0021627E04|nr:sporulation integral membrane protein YtvI [Mechercharimyces sp. CAU 1602]MCS1351611.1 sporulation integral membrane protein YtvI [Mechercharimyces sp. CAU 1602]
MNNPLRGQLTRGVIVLFSTLLLAFTLIISVPLLYPFIIGWLIAMMIEPAVRWLHTRLRFPRWTAVTLMLTIIIGLFTSLFLFIISRIVIEVTRLTERLPEYFNDLNQYLFNTLLHEESPISRIIHQTQEYLENNPAQKTQIMDSIQDNMGVFTQKGTELLTKIIDWIAVFLTDLPYILTVSIFIILASFFISLKWPRLMNTGQTIIPEEIHFTLGVIFNDLRRALLGFLRAQLTLISITFMIVFIGLSILRVEYALTLALIIGFVDLLPYLGVGAAMVPWIGYQFLSGDLSLAIGLLVLYSVIVVFRQMIEPKLIGTSIGLDPLLTLISFFVGLQLFGIIGLLVGPVIMVIMLTLYRAHVFQDLWRYIRGNPLKLTDRHL